MLSSSIATVPTDSNAEFPHCDLPADSNAVFLRRDRPTTSMNGSSVAISPDQLTPSWISFAPIMINDA